MTLHAFIEFMTKAIHNNPGFGDAELFVNGGGNVTGYSLGARGLSVAHDYYPEHCDRSKWEFFEAIFRLSGIKVLNHWELPNQYWPLPYTELRDQNPWWLIKTEQGLVKIGWRKRVISIDWSDTGVEMIVTEDLVTKGKHFVHADSDLQAIEYLRVLAPLLVESGASQI